MVRRRRRRRDRAGEVAQGSADVVDLFSLVWTVVKLPFTVVKAVLDALD
ncbi:hypothetical protein AB2L27_17260 [Kineococcus sp. LSe6-4]|uniref:Uncharacterized protein n=1 Tax=Kineococcus halophytocola TaxID=3234027 RepID=A0ABV4H4M5_9ACTN